MSSKTHHIWPERHRPKTIAECVLPSATKAMFQSYITQGDLPNLILVGSPGVGKTTAALAACNELDIQPLFINGSADGNIDTLRTTIREFAASIGFDGKRRMVILDEADYLNQNSTQPALRSLMEEFAQNCGFILTGNYGNRIIPALHSRASSITFDIPRAEKADLQQQAYTRLRRILKAENVQSDKDLVAEVVKAFWPDMRKMLSEMQKAVVDGVLTPAVLGQQANIQYDELFAALKTRDFKGVRTWVGQNADLDPPRFYRAVFDWAQTNVKPTSLASVIILTADYQYRHGMTMDTQIHITAYCTEVMGNAEFI